MNLEGCRGLYPVKKGNRERILGKANSMNKDIKVKECLGYRPMFSMTSKMPRY
jgi:hypothetical protein